MTFNNLSKLNTKKAMVVKLSYPVVVEVLTPFVAVLKIKNSKIFNKIVYNPPEHKRFLFVTVKL